MLKLEAIILVKIFTRKRYVFKEFIIKYKLTLHPVADRLAAWLIVEVSLINVESCFFFLNSKSSRRWENLKFLENITKTTYVSCSENIN